MQLCWFLQESPNKKKGPLTIKSNCHVILSSSHICAVINVARLKPIKQIYRYINLKGRGSNVHFQCFYRFASDKVKDSRVDQKKVISTFRWNEATYDFAFTTAKNTRSLPTVYECVEETKYLGSDNARTFLVFIIIETFRYFPIFQYSTVARLETNECSDTYKTMTFSLPSRLYPIKRQTSYYTEDILFIYCHAQIIFNSFDSNEPFSYRMTDNKPM